ncbi:MULTISPECIES: heavy metal translocating P-type ATPase [Sphingobium]|jgi:Zn2+/Cd2+-exporting ATPase|uniref:heavy metal translocating P-type ATPase n=1 Tax=Sphingobium TaxID=165695 RepID=UPI0003A9C2B9|nr:MULTISPECIES: heavy metal translocating P-type ATPase [Sphingobium]MBU0555380.1 cadmium-translocating P-type ATPase [Alphaproteobacteria bacterium]AJR26708.1 ATPase [Sphingobium sp. YBL2]AMK20205.1 heavy metal translocating P-type ATPase [Sphingobium sp. MI1205]MBU0793038.1 cadmium-translocating P-type ATPase [Alphaproteobacteria bacterium]MBU0877646.1 cadmium-translocating P-type ATPase [Alphaproteobacteria bacterium]
MIEKLRLDIPVLLPDVTNAADACVKRLVGSLEGRPGVEQAHVVAPEADAPAMLCIHFDPEVVSLSRIRELAHASGAEIGDRFGHAIWQVDGMTHQRRARTLGDRLRGLPGVLEAEANVSGLVRVEFDRSATSQESILKALRDAGARPTYEKAAKLVSTAPERDYAKDHDHPPGKKHDHDHGHGGLLGPNTELIFALACGAALGIGFALEKLVAGAPDWLPFVLYVAAYAFGGFYTLREAIESLRLKRFEIDTLMLVAAAGAAALGAWAEGALLLFLFSLGHALEHYAMGRAKRAIEALAELAPRTAMVRRPDGATSEVPVENLKLGDIVIVKPDERVAADGFIVKGITAINQAPVTGESMPVDKRPVQDDAAARQNPDSVDAASRVFVGTINGSGLVEIEVTRLSNESTLAKVVKLVSEAETQKSPTQRFTDRFERFFVPAVLVLAFVLLFAWVVVDEPFRDSFYRAMAVLVAASPCALAIATPSAVLSGVARAARGGVLIKGGAPLELLGSLDAIAFDKTGTLTKGEPRIQEIITAPGVTKEDLMAVAVAVESLSDHPLAQAIARDGREHIGDKPIPQADNLKSLTGRGVSALVGQEEVLIGKAEMFGADGIAPLSAEMTAAIERLREGGQTSMVVRRDDKDIGAIGLLDTPREAARTALDELRAIGIKRMIMISGDHQRAADAIARKVGIDEAWGDLMPEDKVDAIKKLRAETKVAMVGDGVNDAPAMATATVGIAMGAAGSDVALETADVALMADDLSHLPFAVGLSRRTRWVIRQNVFVSLGVVAFLVPATIFGLGIGPAVAMHEGSTLLVVFNALRLLAYRDRADAIS